MARKTGKKRDIFSYKILAYCHCHQLIWTAYNEPNEHTLLQYNCINPVLSQCEEGKQNRRLIMVDFLYLL